MQEVDEAALAQALELVASGRLTRERAAEVYEIPLEAFPPVETRAARKARQITRAEAEKYIELVSEGHDKTEAAKAIGRTASSLSAFCNRDPELKASLEEAWSAGAEPIIEALTRRAVDGWKQEVYQGGKFVGYKQMYDTVGGIFAVKGRRSEYKDNPKVEVSAAVQVNVEDRSAALQDVWRVLADTGAGEVVEGEVLAEDSGGAAGVELPAAQGVLAEPSDV